MNSGCYVPVYPCNELHIFHDDNESRWSLSDRIADAPNAESGLLGVVVFVVMAARRSSLPVGASAGGGVCCCQVLVVRG